MRKLSLYFTITLLLAISGSFSSCTKKVNGINNDHVVETPYSLFFSDTSGALYSSNDGKTVRSTLFKADGYPCRAICVAGDNILWAKAHLYISFNNGVNFNTSFDSLPDFPFKTCDSISLNLNQSMIVDIPDWNTVFTVSNNPAGNNYLGVVFNLYSGQSGDWWVDIPDTAVPPAASGAFGYYGGPGSVYNVTMTTFSYLPNGTLCGYDTYHNRNFFRTKTTLWHEVTANSDSIDWPNIGDPANRAGNGLPHNVRFSAPGFDMSTDTAAWYSYGHFNNRLIAIDNRNCNGNGAYYSDDNGRNWTQYSGLPAKPLLCIASPFEEISLIGTEGAGLYFLNTNTGAWQLQVNNGLSNNLIIRNIAYKQNIYKNGAVAKFVYLATNKGIYQSTNGGSNWILTIPGNFVAVY